MREQIGHWATDSPLIDHEVSVPNDGEIDAAKWLNLRRRTTIGGAQSPHLHPLTVNRVRCRQPGTRRRRRRAASSLHT